MSSVGGGERPIDLAELRRRAVVALESGRSSKHRHTLAHAAAFAPSGGHFQEVDPADLLALVEAVEAAQALRKMQAVRVVISPGMEQWLVGQGYIRNLDNALARFSFGSSGGGEGTM